MKTDDRYTDPWGRVIFKAEAVLESLYNGRSDFSDVLVEDVPEITRYNALCQQLGHDELCLSMAPPMAMTPEEFHRENCRHWTMPQDYLAVDLEALLLSRCKTPLERQRVTQELALYVERDLLPMLKYLHFMVEHLRGNGLWWGVGRGSSVASFILYLLGVHKIDPIVYGLSVEEFLRT
jgi:DNA polymerase III alpha subunit